MPVIGAGEELTVMSCVRKQPVGIIYEITDVPAVSAVTTPVAPSIDAMAGEELTHEPPVERLFSVAV